jgi:DNA-binding response OmpR family regulator
VRVKTTLTSEAPSTVLLIDDDVLVRTPLAAYLRDCGYTVYEAIDTDEALVVLKAQELCVDVVFSKVVAVGSLDGFALKRWVQQTHPKVPVVLFGSPTGAAAAAGELCEQGPMLAKPYAPQLVEARIRQLLAARDRNSIS